MQKLLSLSSLLLLSAGFAAVGVSSAACEGEGEGEGEEGEGEEGEGEEGEGEGEGEGEEGEGEVDCSGIDAVVGSAVVADGFVVVDSDDVPADPSLWAALATVHHDDGAGTESDEVFALSLGMTVESFGTWPTLAQTDAIPADLTPPGFDPGSDFPGGYLIASETHLVAGYTSADFSGEVVVNTRSGDGGDSTFIGADGNFAAAAVSDHVLVTGLNLGTEDAAGIFGLDDLVTPTAQSILPFAGAPSGYVAQAGDVAVLGTVDGVTFANKLFAVDVAAVDAAFANDAVVTLREGQSPVYESAALGGVFGFADGIAVVDGFLGFGATGVSLVALSRDANDNSVVVAAAAVPVISTPDRCTTLGPIAALDGDLLVTLKHDGITSTMVRLHKN